MQTPYEILDLAVDANDSEIKQAYLQQVKKNPPDRDQQMFQKIHAAYTAIQDHKCRVSHDLFTLPKADFNKIIDQVLQTEQSNELDAESLKNILSISIDDTDLLNAMTIPEK